MKKIVLGVVAVVAVVVLAATGSKCRYCDSTGYGRGCVYAPDKVHRHSDTDERCEFCGNTGYGRGCVYNPAKVHVHGTGNGKCVYAADGVHRK